MPSSSASSENDRQEFQFDEGAQAGKQGLCGGKNTFLKVTGIFAALAVLVLVIILPVYFEVIEPNNAKDDSKATTTVGVLTAKPTTTGISKTSATTLPTVQSTTTDGSKPSTTAATVQPTTPYPTLPENERFNCMPGEGASEEECDQRGCMWNDTASGTGAPSCYFVGPRLYSLNGSPTTNTGNTNTTSLLELRNENASDHYGRQFKTLRVETTYITDTTVRIKIYPDGEDRYEVPIDHPSPVSTGSFNTSIYTVEHSTEDDKFGVKISRTSTSSVVFDTSVGELMFADQFLQISTKVASEYVYGFGEHMRRSFKHDMNWKTYGMFTYDQNVKFDYNLYGVQTYFMCMEGDGNAYGVFFVNSNAMEVELQPTPAITYRTIGGLLDFYVFLGPSPEQVTQQYMGVVGMPYFPPYWSLGFQLCRWNYGSLEKLQEVVNRTLESGIPYDVQYSDIDYMERQMDFTIDKEMYGGITEFVQNLKETYKMRYIIILDPAISGNETDYPAFDNGVKDDIFLKFDSGEIAWGKVWPDLPNITIDDSKDKEYKVENYRAHTAYPDFFHPNATNWWKELIIDFRNNISFDALWIDMNEPTSFTNGTVDHTCPETPYDNPPFYPNLVADEIYDLTICMQTLQYNPKTNSYTQHYNLHSLYGWSEVVPTLEACREATGERCLVLTRATYPGAGKNSGHWLGDNASTWEYLRTSIIGMMEFSLFGFPYNGADVCGFFQNTTMELCLRWMQVGAFYPFYRNHNVEKTIDQDPAVFGEEFIKNITVAMRTRYELLPYLYTLFYEAHTTGSTVVRPLMHEFQTDSNTYDVDAQFLWGPALLITAVLEEGNTSVNGYFPKARWFSYYDGTELNVTDNGTYIDLPTAMDEINVHVRGGYVIPTQESANNTYYSRQNPLGIVVALDDQFKASGQLFWDDGNNVNTIENENYTLISFSCAESRLNITITKNATEGLDVSSLFFDKITIFGINENVSDVVVNTEDGTAYDTLSIVASGDYDWTSENGALSLSGLELSLAVDHYVTWR